MTTIWTTKENERLFKLAAKHGIDPAKYKTLSECIAQIKTLEMEESAFLAGWAMALENDGDGRAAWEHSEDAFIRYKQRSGWHLPETPEQEVERVCESAGRVVGELRTQNAALRAALRFIVDRENLMFAECSDAEEIIAVAKAALA